ncbi:coiled-coil domain-containing protein 13 [Scaptodrosophila lebanonensis]|uniref:Coiled-coil domain-containing protein 13 n=1 Tax=Drosophila lebanonensis TaxID=7225 RepID=A0A6J2UEK5_DROLE|nr:coiled-coil domain-containing protein 13 [Scaptodrosophila lebanonensis]
MDVLHSECLQDEHKTEKSARRKREDKELDGHVVVGTTAGKPRQPKPEGKKLRKKLHEFEQENETLAKAISEKNMEITALKRSVDSLNDVLNSVPIDELRCNSSIASTKIVELSKKNRQMRAELVQMKSRLNKKDAQINKLEKELKSNEEKTHQHSELIKKGNAADDLQLKISNMQQKLFESRNKNLELQNQLKLAQKCLQHEIGESFNINTLAANLNQANWRGRAQQILSLQQKVQELKARLESYEDRLSDRSDFVPIPVGADMDLVTTKTTPRCANASLGGGDANVATFDRFTPGVRKSEILHKAKVEALEKEIAALQAQLEEQRNKTLALKVRNKTLNDEMVKYKHRSSELEEQTDYNGINICTMNEKLNRQRHQYENRLDDVRNDLARVIEERDAARRQMEELAGINLELETSLKQKEVFVDTLQEMVKKLETDLRSVSGGFLFSCREFRKEEFVSILDALEVEKNQLMLLNKTLTERLEAERVKNDASAEQMGKQKARISRMEGKIRELEKELDVQSDRKKRTQRMADYANSLSRTSLSSSISSFTFENQSQCQSVSTLNSVGVAEPKIEDIKNQLELAQEKITMLTEKLDYLTEEKRNDAKFFEESLLNTRTIILDTIQTTREKFTALPDMPTSDSI